jgi:hypothetical protein
MTSQNIIVTDFALISIMLDPISLNGPAISMPQPGRPETRLAMDIKTPRLRVAFVESPRKNERD